MLLQFHNACQISTHWFYDIPVKYVNPYSDGDSNPPKALGLNKILLAVHLWGVHLWGVHLWSVWGMSLDFHVHFSIVVVIFTWWAPHGSVWSNWILIITILFVQTCVELKNWAPIFQLISFPSQGTFFVARMGWSNLKHWLVDLALMD